MSEEQQAELDYLKYFYDEVYDFLGPAAGDAYWSIRERYKQKGGALPEKYEEE